MENNTRESRHTCIVCGRKRYSSRMEIVNPHCHTGLPQWACKTLYSRYKWNSTRCADAYRDARK